MDDPMIPELALGYARLGGYQAATTLANAATLSDTKSAWIVGDYGTGLIRGLTTKKVIEEYESELRALNDGRRVSDTDLGKGPWWKKAIKQPRSAPLSQTFGTSGFKGLDLGGRAFIVHRPAIPSPDPTTTYTIADVYDEDDDEV